ncbi:MAG: ABC transporter substrate-binding protein [Deltaproteobacteria bacterium]|nr:ABC transporter substrate-binding protein [Deltaproteobacteria bacterium]
MPSLTGIVIELGLAEHLVGVTSYCSRPECADLPKVGTQFAPDYERVVGLRPDVVLVEKAHSEVVDRYTKLGVPTLVLPTDSIEGVYESIGAVGERFGKVDEARALIHRMQSKFDEVRSRVKGAKPVRTLLILGLDGDSLRQLFAVGGGNFMDQMVKIAGGENVLADAAIDYPRLSKELVVQRSPEAIVVIAEPRKNNADLFAAQKNLWADLATVDAVRNDRIYLVDGPQVLLPSPDMPTTAERIARALHPERWEKSKNDAN